MHLWADSTVHQDGESVSRTFLAWLLLAHVPWLSHHCTAHEVMGVSAVLLVWTFQLQLQRRRFLINPTGMTSLLTILFLFLVCFLHLCFHLNLLNLVFNSTLFYSYQDRLCFGLASFPPQYFRWSIIILMGIQYSTCLNVAAWKFWTTHQLTTSPLISLLELVHIL